MRFDCPRTCPRFADRWCRFRPVLDQIGPVKVDSHTARLKVEFASPFTLADSVKELGGKWIGLGTHKLFQSDLIHGHAFTLPGWKFPLVAQGNGELAFDDYGGRWGNVKDVEKLKAAYAAISIEQSAAALGWQTERTEAGVIVHHPSGGSLTLTNAGQLDLNGFQGKGCHQALLDLGLPLENIEAKAEYTAAEQTIKL